MISTNKDFDFLPTNKRPEVYYLLSTDTKPTKGVVNGAFTLELDTDKGYFFDREHEVWREV